MNMLKKVIVLAIILILLPVVFAFPLTPPPSFFGNNTMSRGMPPYLYNINYSMYLNESYLNATIDRRYNATAISGSASFYKNYLGSALTGSSGNVNRTLSIVANVVAVDNYILHPDVDYVSVNGTIIFFNPIWDDMLITTWEITDNSTWNQTFADTLYMNINATPDNESWNQSYANTLYLNRSSEDLYTTTYNSTYDAKVTDNSSWNETHANTLYMPINATTGNSSFNESLTDAKYVPYIGAIQDVDLGNYNYNTTGSGNFGSITVPSKTGIYTGTNSPVKWNGINCYFTGSYSALYWTKANKAGSPNIFNDNGVTTPMTITLLTGREPVINVDVVNILGGYTTVYTDMSASEVVAQLSGTDPLVSVNYSEPAFTLDPATGIYTNVMTLPIADNSGSTTWASPAIINQTSWTIETGFGVEQSSANIVHSGNYVNNNHDAMFFLNGSMKLGNGNYLSSTNFPITANEVYSSFGGAVDASMGFITETRIPDNTNAFMGTAGVFGANWLLGTNTNYTGVQVGMWGDVSSLGSGTADLVSGIRTGISNGGGGNRTINAMNGFEYSMSNRGTDGHQFINNLYEFMGGTPGSAASYFTVNNSYGLYMPDMSSYVTGEHYGVYDLDNAYFGKDVVIVGNLTAPNICYSNGTNCISSDNSSWNQSYANTLYASISLVGDNSSWNESYANTLYLNRTSEALYTTTYNSTYDAKVTDNSSWNQSYANTLYAPISLVGDNSSWNQSYANTLYAPISLVGDNSSWNESYANTLYLNRTSEALYTTTYNSTYDAKVTDNSSWNESYANTLYLNNSFYSGWSNTSNMTYTMLNVSIGSTNPLGILDVTNGLINDSYSAGASSIDGMISNPYLAIGYSENYLLQSESFATTWTTMNITTPVADSAISPVGTLIAERLYGNISNTNAGIKQRLSNTSVGNFTFSVWLRNDNVNASNTVISINIDTDNQSTIAKNITLLPEWKRYSVTQLLNNTHINKTVYITIGANNVSAWGAQLENGSYARIYAAARTTTATTASAGLIYARLPITSTGALSSSAGLSGTTGSFTGIITQTTATAFASISGLILQSTTAATLAAPIQLSTRLLFAGTAWDTGLGATTTQNIKNELDVTSGNPSKANLIWEYGYNSVADVSMFQIMNLESNGTLNVFGNTFGTSVLNNSNFTGSNASWYWNGGWSINTTLNMSRYQFSVGANGNLSQNDTQYLTAVTPNAWYKLSYNVSGTGVAGCVAYVNKIFSTEDVYLPGVSVVTAGQLFNVYFKTNAAPSNFTITARCTAGSFYLDTIDLREVLSGDINAYGNLTGRNINVMTNYSVNGTAGITGNYNCTSYPNVTIKGGIITSWVC